MSATNCKRCGRFTGEDGVEICDSTYANPSDPDGWTDTYLCGMCLDKERGVEPHSHAQTLTLVGGPVC